MKLILLIFFSFASVAVSRCFDVMKTFEHGQAMRQTEITIRQNTPGVSAFFIECSVFFEKNLHFFLFTLDNSPFLLMINSKFVSIGVSLLMGAMKEGKRLLPSNGIKIRRRGNMMMCRKRRIGEYGSRTVSRRNHAARFTLIELLITNTCQIYIYSKG